MQTTRTAVLPAWPLTMVAAAFMVWWAVGLIDVIWVIAGILMVGLMALVRGLEVPRGWAVWMIFIVTMIASASMIDTLNHAVEFSYRASIYLACTVLFVYVYNARSALNDRKVTGLLTMLWLWTVLGGFLGLLLPNMRLRTPTYYLLDFLSPKVSSIGFINEMVVRRFAQYNPDSYLGTPARPSAPYLYANNWGSLYSLLLPFVIAYMLQVRETRRFWLLAVAVPISLVPAFLSLNRGMLIGLLVSAVYVAGRLALRRRVLPLVLLVLGTVVAALVFNAIAASRLEARVQDSSTGTRAYLYTASLEATADSPFLGYGVPVQTEDPDKPPVGTQGQFWMLLVSNGIIGSAAFVGWLLVAWWRTRRRGDPIAVVSASVLLVGLVELVFYGMVPYGLPVLMIAAALGMRPAQVTAGSQRRQLGTEPRRHPDRPTAVVGAGTARSGHLPATR